MTIDNNNNRISNISTIMDSYMASLRAQPDLGFLAFLKLSLRKNDELSGELTDWLVESWWGLMAEVQEPSRQEPKASSSQYRSESYTAPDGMDQALLARLLHMRIKEGSENLALQPSWPLKNTPTATN